MMQPYSDSDDLLCAPVWSVHEAVEPLPETIVVVSEKMIVSDLTEDADEWNMREYWQEEEEEESDEASFAQGETNAEEPEEETTEMQYQKMLHMLEEESFFFKRGCQTNAAIVGSSYRVQSPVLHMHTESTEELHYTCLREELVEELL